MGGVRCKCRIILQSAIRNLQSAISSIRLPPSLLIVLLLLVTTVSLAQNDEEKPSTVEEKSSQAEEKLLRSSLNLHQWGAVTLFHGLPSDHVRAIAQDADGLLWFGTDGGLAKYDGRRTQKVVAEGLPSGSVRALRLDGSGGLWIGTDTGATRLVGEKFTRIAETAGHAITAIITPEKGRAVLASEEGVVYTCSTGTNGSLGVQTIGPRNSPLLSRIDSRGNNTSLSLTSLAFIKNILLIGTRGRGLLAIDGTEVKEIFSRPRAYFVGTIELDSSGRPWFGTETSGDNSGLYESGDLLHPQKVGSSTGPVTALCFDSRGDLWTGTDGRGAFHYRDSRELEHFTSENSAGGLRSNHVYSVFVDREGVVWFGTDRGVCRYDPNSPHAERVSYNPESNFVRALFKSADGRLWCGTNRGLFARENRTIEWQPVEELKDKAVYSIAGDKNGRLLVGSAGGLYAGRTESPETLGGRRFTRIDNVEDGSAPGDSVRAICNFQGATYIASFGRGIERLDGTSRTLIWPTESTNPREREVLSLHADGSERMWIGTAEAGAFIFDGKQVISDSSLGALRGSAVRAIDGTGSGWLWFATGRGLYCHWSGRLISVLEGSDVRSVVVSGSPKSVWCATERNGLFKVSVDEWARPIIARLDTEHGLPSDNVFTIFPDHSPSGEEVLWIGTNRGIAFYEPGNVPPVLRVTRILGKRSYQPEELQAGLSLQYPQNSLVLDVAAISSRTFSEQFQYSFLLLDGAGGIIKQGPARDSQFLMENLRPGRYRVEARAYTNDLVTSNPLVFQFNVASAPFPRTTVALSVLLALSLFALWWGYYQNRKIARTNTALAAANQQLADTRMQLANETENERRRIARDLHDQTLSDLRRLLLLTDQLPAGITSYSGDTINPVIFRDQIESISTEIRRICEDLSPSVLANVGLTAALEWALADAVAHLPAKRKFEYEFVCSDEIEEHLHFDSGVQIQLYRIVQEAISNICHHAAAKHVRLDAEITDDGAFVVKLEDDGCGFNTTGKATGTGRGLSNIRSRASLIEAEVNWSPRPGGGTLFTLRKPISSTQKI